MLAEFIKPFAVLSVHRDGNGDTDMCTFTLLVILMYIGHEAVFVRQPGRREQKKGSAQNACQHGALFVHGHQIDATNASHPAFGRKPKKCANSQCN